MSGIEDELQDGVPEAIKTLTAANIKIWILTGIGRKRPPTLPASLESSNRIKPLIKLQDPESARQFITKPACYWVICPADFRGTRSQKS